MNYNLYNATHKSWDHVGNVTPNVEYSEAIRPHGEFMVADYLPVGRYDKFYEHYFVVSAGKAVAFDRFGRVVPAGLKVAWAVASGTVLAYAAVDATEKVINLTTGVAVTGAVNYTRTQLTAALLARGYIDSTENAEDFISYPIGVAPYNYIQWCGGDGSNPALYRQHNYNMQPRVGILCRYVIELPVVPASGGSVAIGSADAISGSAIADWTTSNAAGSWFNATALAATTRYAADVGVAPKNPNVVALNLPVMSMAKNTTITPMTLPVGFTREVDSIAGLTTAGDYFFDYDVGVILFYKLSGAAAAVGSVTFTFYYYDAIPATVSTYACALGALKPGDYVKADANSNFVKVNTLVSTDFTGLTTADPETSLTYAEMALVLNVLAKRQDEVIGQVLDGELYPKDFLERVRTMYPDMGVTDRMPGSASGGMPDAITYAGGSNRKIRILILK